MYLRSYGGDKERHEYTRASAKGGTAQRGGGSSSVNRKDQRTIDCSFVREGYEPNWSSEPSFEVELVQLVKTATELEAGLKRGMSEGERAVITPRIGWRKLADPGD